MWKLMDCAITQSDKSKTYRIHIIIIRYVYMWKKKVEEFENK